MAAGKINLQANDGKVAGVVFEDGASSNVTVTVPKEGGVLATQSGLDTAMSTINASVPAAYHIYNGQLSLSNTVTTAGFSTTLYTGNGTSQSITTGVDMATQWGNDASETFGGLVWLKSRSNGAYSHRLYNSVIGATKSLLSDSTSAEITDATSLTAFSSSGFSLGTLANINGVSNSMVSWNFQTTHRVSGTTNHGKAFTCHYNPFTGFTIVKYEGSGIAGHEIPHHLGKRLGFWQIKNLMSAVNWLGGRDGIDATKCIQLNIADAESAPSTSPAHSCSSDFLTVGTNTNINTSGQQHIMYGWANSYFDEKNTLIGNYEIGVYQGTGTSGNKVTTRGKPAWILTKRLDSADNWYILDNMRNLGDAYLVTNQSSSETTGTDMVDFVSDGFIVKNIGAGTNASGGQYLYMVVYDNDSGSGKSKYPRATDTSTLNLNAHVPFANGIDATGSKVSIAYKNETITLSNALTQGKNYIALLDDGSYVATPYEPMYSMRNRSKAGENPDYFDLGKQKWFETTGGSELVTNRTFDTTTSGWTATNATLSIDNARIKVTTTTTSLGIASQSIVTTIGKTYRIKLGVYGGNQAAYWTVGTTIGGTDIIPYQASVASGSFVAFDMIFVATSTTTYINLMANNGAIGYTALFDNISCFEATPTVGTAITPRNYLDCIVYADQNGQPEYVEQIEKVQYFDAVKANDYRGKNACTALISFDGTATPITIRDSYNVSAIIRVATGVFDIYFKEQMDNTGYSIAGTGQYYDVESPQLNRYLNKVQITTGVSASTRVNDAGTTVIIMGGKN